MRAIIEDSLLLFRQTRRLFPSGSREFYQRKAEQRDTLFGQVSTHFSKPQTVIPSVDAVRESFLDSRCIACFL